MIKNKILNIRLPEEDYLMLQDRAQVNNMSVAKYVRERIFYDIPQIEHNSFEFKTIKGISYCVGTLAALIRHNLPKPAQLEAEDEARRIMIKNGIDESSIQPKNN